MTARHGGTARIPEREAVRFSQRPVDGTKARACVSVAHVIANGSEET